MGGFTAYTSQKETSFFQVIILANAQAHIDHHQVSITGVHDFPFFIYRMLATPAKGRRARKIEKTFNPLRSDGRLSRP